MDMFVGVTIAIAVCAAAGLSLYIYLEGPKKKVVCSTCSNFSFDNENKICIGTFNRVTHYTWENMGYTYAFPPSEINKNNDCKHYSEAMLTGGYQPRRTNKWPPPPPPPLTRVISEDVKFSKLFKKGKQ